MASNKIRELRKAAGLTQEQLAAHLDIKRATLARYEAGTIDPPTSKLQAIAAALGATVGELVDFSGMSPEDRKKFWESSPPPQIPTDAQTRITTALGKLNDAGMEKAAAAVEIIAEVPRYQAGHATQEDARPLSPAPEGTDTTPPPDGSEQPPEGE